MKQRESDQIKLTTPVELSGCCLCGGVSYHINGKARDIVNCFCTQCQKTSGHYVAATRIAKKDLVIHKDASLRWYESTPGYKRGFCNRCGGNLFWECLGEDQISIMAGTLDKPTGLKTVQNIYVQSASDYFDIPHIR